MVNYALPSQDLNYGSALGTFGMPGQGGYEMGVPAPVALPAVRPTSPTPSMAAGMNFGTGPGLNSMTGAQMLPSRAANVGAADLSFMDRAKGTFFGESGFNMDNIGAFAETLGSLGTLWSGIQSNRIAKESLGLQKQAYKTNLEGQRTAFNKGLTDQANVAFSRREDPSGQAAYISQFKLGD